MLKRIWALIKKEFFIIWRDPKSRSLIIIPPLLQLFVFAHAVTMEIKNIDMAIWDQNQTAQSRELIAKFDNSKWFRHIILTDRIEDIERNINTQNVQIGMIIPPDFSKKLSTKKPTQIQIIVDGRQTNSAAIGSNYASQIINAFEDEYYLNTKKTGPNIAVEVRNWYNPNLMFVWYTVISLLSLLALMITLLLTALSIAREREIGTFDQLIVSPLSAFEILVGKTIPPLGIAVCLTAFMTTIAINVFKIPFRGSFLVFLFATIVTLLSIVGIGLFISSICKTQQQAILGVFTFQMPAVILSGFVSPVENMPLFFQYLSYFDPIRFFMVITKGLFLKGMPFIDVFHNLIPLMIIAVFTLSAAWWMFKQKLD